MKKIAICIPTYKEEDTIALITRKIDYGLAGVGCFEKVIVNCNNLDIDNTKRNFLLTRTESEKIYLESGEIGKGNNILAFITFCLENDVDYALTLDADVISMEPEWVTAMLAGLIEDRVDYVTPLYYRNAYEGSTTNHFAFPFIYSFTGEYIRQPIGGDFAFNKSFMEYIVKCPVNNSIKRYGIDIFLTINAVCGTFRVGEVFLGEKKHKPSFHKMYNMSGEVIDAAIFTAKEYTDFPYKRKTHSTYIETIENGIVQKGSYIHQKEAGLLYDEAKGMVEKLLSVIGNFISCGVSQIESMPIDIIWELILVNICQKMHNIDSNNKELMDAINALFVMRAVTFWNQIAEGGQEIDAEKMIVNQAKRIYNRVLL